MTRFGVLVRANEGKLSQVFLNLLVNAAHSITEGAADKNEIVLRGRFLVVDDEPKIAHALRTIFGEKQTVVCTSSKEAFELLQGGARFDAIICDVIMPDGTAADLYEQVRTLAPHQAGRIVFVTGGAFTERTKAFLENVPNPRLEKPFDIARLIDVVSRVSTSDEAVA